MANIPGTRNIIQVEEVAASSAISSGTGGRLGANDNFILTNFGHTIHWEANGAYSNTTGKTTIVDGAKILLRNLELIGFGFFIETAGSAGITEIDIKRQVASGSTGTSIFSVRPSISYSAGDRSKVVKIFDPATDVYNPAGTVLPVFSTTLFNAGDALFLDFISRQTGSSHLTVDLYFRVRE